MKIIQPKKNGGFVWILIIMLAVFLNLNCDSRNQTKKNENLLNFKHLDHLYETIRINHKKVGIIHIYSEAPDYKWVEAKNEGISCVDDVARAAVLYLRQYDLTQNEHYFKKARSLLKFILAMQAPNGLFYNFILPGNKINKTRRNSVNRFDFWTARAVWALGEGYSITQRLHPDFANSLKKSIIRVLPEIRKLLNNYPDKKIISGTSYPTWLVNKYAADATSELLLGLIAFGRATNDVVVRKDINKLSQGLILMQQGNWQSPPYGAHLSYPNIWHGWGNSQTEALSLAGEYFNLAGAISSSRKEADWFYSRLIIDGWLSQIILDDSTRTDTFPQIAYEVRTVTLGLLNLFGATGKRKYAILAGLAGTWLFGNNPAKATMYDPKTGRCFDGIQNRQTVNLNSGAESTIEALLTLQALQAYPIAQKYVFFRKRSERKYFKKNGIKVYKYRIFLNRRGEKIVVVLDLRKGKLETLNINVWKNKIEQEN